MKPAGNRVVARVVALFFVVAVATAGAAGIATSAGFPALHRFATDFSAAYLSRELAKVARERPDAVFLGDSVVWGYRILARDTAVDQLARRGCSCVNFAFKSGGPPNEYALVRLLTRTPLTPRTVVLEINQRTLNRVDPSYRTLQPAVRELADPLLDESDRRALGITEPGTFARLESLAEHVWPVYAMRSDVREAFGGDTDDRPVRAAAAPAPEDFEGTYDLSPLGAHNLGVGYLAAAARRLRDAGVRLVAFTTPTNHRLLHAYVDDPAYRANDAYLVDLLRRNGATVLDLDAAFPAADFIDNDHLNERGQRRLADALAPYVMADARRGGKRAGAE
jgi:hypothetical protein